GIAAHSGPDGNFLDVNRSEIEPVQLRTPVVIPPPLFFASHAFDRFSPFRRQPRRSHGDETALREQSQNGARLAAAPANPGDYDRRIKNGGFHAAAFSPAARWT